MKVKQNKASFPYPTMFIAGAWMHTNAEQAVGTLIAKQTVNMNGFIDLANQAKIEIQDTVDSASKMTKYESDLAVYKGALDPIVIKNNWVPADPFGTVRIEHANQNSGEITINYGWLERGSDSRKLLAGTDLANFVPTSPLDLPNNFKNQFFNSSPIPVPATLASRPLLSTNDRITFTPSGGVARSLTIPQGPHFIFRRQEGDIPNPAPTILKNGVDTIVFDQFKSLFLLIWRFVFVWETWMELGSLEIS